jgi:hypothetical protein
VDEIRVQLKGDHAKLGAVPAADVARLILLVEKAAAQAAAVVLGQPKTGSGRYSGIIEKSVHFRLRGIEEGSVVPVLALPEPSSVGNPPMNGQDALETQAATLAEAALSKLFEAATEPAPEPAVAKALLELADGMHVGDRYEAIVFSGSRRGALDTKTRVDGSVRSHLRAYVDSAPAAPMREDALMGVLVEADFEKRTARLRTPSESGIEVDFGDDLDDDIHAALRQPATLRGEVIFDPKSSLAKAIHLRQVEHGEQLIMGLDPTAFWDEPSFHDLALRQGTGEPVNPAALYSPDASEEEKDAFMAALAELD